MRHRLEAWWGVARRLHQAVWLGGSLAVLGFVMMFLSWRGVARTFFVPSQMSFVVSGGLLGLGALATGLTVCVSHLLRVLTARRSHHLDLVKRDVLELVALAAQQRQAERRQAEEAV